MQSFLKNAKLIGPKWNKDNSQNFHNPKKFGCAEVQRSEMSTIKAMNNTQCIIGADKKDASLSSKATPFIQRPFGASTHHIPYPC